VRPELAVFQVGYRNRFNHPKPEVYERYGRMPPPAGPTNPAR
jgi:competence protein ComEC